MLSDSLNQTLLTFVCICRLWSATSTYPCHVTCPSTCRDHDLCLGPYRDHVSDRDLVRCRHHVYRSPHYCPHRAYHSHDFDGNATDSANDDDPYSSSLYRACTTKTRCADSGQSLCRICSHSRRRLRESPTELVAGH